MYADNLDKIIIFILIIKYDNYIECPHQGHPAPVLPVPARLVPPAHQAHQVHLVHLVHLVIQVPLGHPSIATEAIITTIITEVTTNIMMMITIITNMAMTETLAYFIS